jgi:hypothetical protein
MRGIVQKIKQKIKQKISFSDTALVAPPALFRPLEFQQKMACSWGK